MLNTGKPGLLAISMKIFRKLFANFDKAALETGVKSVPHLPVVHQTSIENYSLQNHALRYTRHTEPNHATLLFAR